MSFTVAELEELGRLLSTKELPSYTYIPPSPDHPTPHPAQKTFYTLYSIHELSLFRRALGDQVIARYALTSQGELRFGHEGDPGKTIPEHHQMVNDDEITLGAGNICFNRQGEVTGLNNQTDSYGEMSFESMLPALFVLWEHNIPLAAYIDLIQMQPLRTVSLDTTQLKALFHHMSTELKLQLETANAPDHSDDELDDFEFDDHDHRSSWTKARPSPNASDRLNFFSRRPASPDDFITLLNAMDAEQDNNQTPEEPPLPIIRR